MDDLLSSALLLKFKPSATDVDLNSSKGEQFIYISLFLCRECSNFASILLEGELGDQKGLMPTWTSS
ncbi:hypothetical protein T03_348 [Trichinella britovi]|uniref:Uncharacterized protein n=1 Tax=Trichinella britovi TaxID=45882 RepID=A0A0V1CSX0_TRIBR|nr:hypothetical protein T03_348 [Trichinella britovi]KRZ96559.1 hypothetical protein T08_2923 [Trichinella sp. T8]